MLYPAPELPDDTPIDNVRFVTRIRNALNAAGMKTIGEVRETSDDRLLSRTLAGVRSPIFVRRWARRRLMACLRCKRNPGKVEMDVPTHRERQFMQHLRAGGWVKANVAPAGARLIENLLAKGWIEKRGVVPNDISYRITDKGLAAKKMPVRVYS